MAYPYSLRETIADASIHVLGVLLALSARLRRNAPLAAIPSALSVSHDR